MLTRDLEPETCAPSVFEHGVQVFVTYLPEAEMESWVRQVAARSGQSVDWHQGGGRCIVKALGDINRVSKAIEELMPEHDRLRDKMMHK